tara:strand:- start:582 stop:872 length:291 start_codon:yes stop_codon:yes gene_type:complete
MTNNKNNYYLKDVVKVVAVRQSLTVKEATKAASFLVERFTYYLLLRYKIRLVKFASFYIKRRGSKLTTHPVTSKTYKIKARNCVQVDFSKQLKQLF